MPFVIVLSVTGTIYLFRPQIEAWEERGYDNLPKAASVTDYGSRVQAAVGISEGLRFAGVEATSEPAAFDPVSSATRVLVQDQAGEISRVHVSPFEAEVLGSVRESERFTRLVRRIHGELLLGKRGSYLVELVASWTIVMVVTGMTLWMPKRIRFFGVVIPRVRSTGKVFWKDLHSVIGFWASGLIVFLIITGLPWSTFWGDYFKKVRSITGATLNQQHWDGGHAKHKPQKSPWRTVAPDPESYSLEEVNGAVRYAQSLNWLAPVIVEPPSDATSFWKIKSMTANRPYRQSLRYNVTTKEIVDQETFAGRHWVDRVVGQGIALHEGQRFSHYRFGWINQLFALFATCSLVLLSCTGVVLWYRRRDTVGLSPPPMPKDHGQAGGQGNFTSRRSAVVLAVVVILAVYLPLFGLSAILVSVFDHFLFSRSESLATWLGRV